MSQKNPKKYVYVRDKCEKPKVDMGQALVFADAIPGVCDNVVRPFGWTEYESAYRPQYVPDPRHARRPCRDPCKPRVVRKPPLRQFADPNCSQGRIGICTLCNMVKCQCQGIPPPWSECREKIVIYDPDSVRQLYIHNELKTEHPIVVSNAQYQRIFNAATVKSKEEKLAECKKAEGTRETDLKRCHDLAEEMRLIDACRIRDSLSPEAREDMDEILCRADKIIRNEEPEIRTINQVILAAKVQAIREAQLAEKIMIRCEEAEEEKRLFALLQQDKAHTLVHDDEAELERLEAKKEALKAGYELQIDEKEAYKYLEKQMLEAEREQLKRIWERQEMEDITKRNLELEKKHNLGKVLMENQLEILQQKKEDKEFEKAQDIRLMEWQKQRREEEEKAEKEKNDEHKAKEMANRAQGEAQKRQSDTKALRDDLRAKRHQEEQEREWRRREKEAIRKREEDTRELRRTILNQIRDRQDFFCEQATYDKLAYDSVFDIQSQKFEDEKKLQEEKKMENARYRYALREQIHDYQLRRVQERKEHFIEGITLRRDLAKRERELKCTMAQKLDELQESNLPERYLNYIRKAVSEELKPAWQKSSSIRK